VYNNANELLFHHYTGSFGQQNNNNNNNQQPFKLNNLTMNNSSGMKNVQKYVQSINENFSKIFANSVNSINGNSTVSNGKILILG
jgi:hypothetical protein